jgi:hypothetical protein
MGICDGQTEMLCSTDKSPLAECAAAFVVASGDLHHTTHVNLKCGVLSCGPIFLPDRDVTLTPPKKRILTI